MPVEGRSPGSGCFGRGRGEEIDRWVWQLQKIRTLQKKLYVKARSEPEFRFYLLYDKVWRADILEHAYLLCRANGGAAGVDGVTFEHIEAAEGGLSARVALACRGVKPVREPDAGKLHVRFDERVRETGLWSSY